MRLTNEEKNRLAKSSTTNPEAYQLYLCVSHFSAVLLAPIVEFDAEDNAALKKQRREAISIFARLVSSPLVIVVPASVQPPLHTRPPNPNLHGR